MTYKAETGFTEREEAITAFLTRAFEGRMLEARILDVHKQEGGTAAVLRFTVDQEASSDLDRERIEASGEPVDELAAIVADDLRAQLA